MSIVPMELIMRAAGATAEPARRLRNLMAHHEPVR
jgi:hypothetical protein